MTKIRKKEEISNSIHSSSNLRKYFAYLFSSTFILMGFLTVSSNWYMSLPFFSIGFVELFFLFRYVANIDVLHTCIRISMRGRKEEVSWQDIKCIKQITYCTRHLWRIRFNQPRRSVYFFSIGRGMIDFLKTKVKMEIIFKGWFPE